MTTPRQDLIAKIDKALGRRRLYWFGTRGADGNSLSDVPQFSGSFTIIDKYKWPLEWNECWENHPEGYRVDLDNWEIDDNKELAPSRDLRSAMLAAMSYDNALVPYRPCEFLSDLTFVRHDTTWYLGLFSGHQRAFEHKPWVETAVSQLGIGWLEWKYLSRKDWREAEDMLRRGSIVVRPARGSGGYGMHRVDDLEQLAEFCPPTDDTYTTVSRFRSDALPLNVGGVVWDDGVTVHFPSIQLIGIPSCTSREFGYCGNDFGLLGRLDQTMVDELERTMLILGNWMRNQGYRGAFGGDFLLNEEGLLFTEINPRFQGSTRVSSNMSVLRDEPCVLLDHVAAMLHLPCPTRPPLRDVVLDGALAHVVIHNPAGKRATAEADEIFAEVGPLLKEPVAAVKLSASVAVEPDATIMSLHCQSPLTINGYQLVSPAIQDAIRVATDQYLKPVPESEDAVA